MEAATSSGSSSRQILFKVQLPVARPALQLASNQAIILVLSMVVVGGIVGGQALGYNVVAGLAQNRPVRHSVSRRVSPWSSSASRWTG